MSSPVRMFTMKQELSERELSTVPQLMRDDICFFRFIGGNSIETTKLAEQLHLIKSRGVLLIGVFRFPFRFEGKKRFQIAVQQYHCMKEICDAVTYLNSDGMMEILQPGTSIQDAHGIFDSLEEAPIQAISESIRISGEMNIDVQDIRTFLKDCKGPLYVRTFEGDTFDEPLKYAISAPYLPQNFTDGTHMIINIGYTKNVDMVAFQQINLRLNDLFHKADLFKLGSYYINEPGQRFKITLLIHGMQDPYPRPAQLGRFMTQQLWLKRKMESFSKKSWKARKQLS